MYVKKGVIILICTILAVLVVFVSFYAISSTNSGTDTDMDSVSIGYVEIDSIDFRVTGASLVYDSSTDIVYQKIDTYYSHFVYTPYLAENGLPYKYNPTTGELEEIPYTITQTEVTQVK